MPPALKPPSAPMTLYAEYTAAQQKLSRSKIIKYDGFICVQGVQNKPVLTSRGKLESPFNLQY